MELLLINHPLDCPVCDKGGKCPLQNQAMSNGRVETRFEDIKRTFPKPINLSSQVLLDRERCVLAPGAPGSPSRSPVTRSSRCWNAARCSRSASPRAGPSTPTSAATPCRFCPVGAPDRNRLTGSGSALDLVSSPSVCEHCASGCAQRTDHRRGVRAPAGRRRPGGQRGNGTATRAAGRSPTPGSVTGSPLPGARRRRRPAPGLVVGGRHGRRCRLTAGRTGVLVGGRVTAEDAYAYRSSPE